MPKRVTLLALWAVFAVASVSVGFAAASVVSDPFTDAGASSEVPQLAGSGDPPATEPEGSASPSTRSPSPSATPSDPGGSTTKGPGAGSATVKRGISTRGGYVSATCRDGLVTVGAAPAVWWQVDSYTEGRVREARVRLEPSRDANGRRVEVTASCRDGIPVFSSDYDHGGGGDDSDDSGGNSGSGGSSGSGGGGSGGSDDDSSGSGSG